MAYAYLMHCELLIGGTLQGGACDSSTGKSQVYSPYDGHLVGTAAEGDWTHMDSALESASDAFESFRSSPVLERQAILRRSAALVRERQDELAKLLTNEVGKPIQFSRGEVERLALTFELAADYLSQHGGEVYPTGFDSRGGSYRCIVERFPVGPVLAIVPYNWPYNLAAHKIAPAIAAGNTVVVKPSGRAPLTTMTLAHIVHEAGAPDGVINVVNVDSRHAQRACEDDRVKFISFTGSDAVGWKLKELGFKKKVSLELGGDAHAIVMPDFDLAAAADRIAYGSFGYAGQICISTQHVLVHREVLEPFKEQLIRATQETPFGDPTDENVVCGPMIDSDDADRVMEWLEEALEAGAELLAGGNRVGNIIEPTLVWGAPKGSRLSEREIFGPVITLRSFDDLDEAIEIVNASRYGLQAGVFTHDVRVAEKAFRGLDVGGVVIGDFAAMRFDNMPYGGVKQSGFGREGIAFAYEEMTEPRVMLVKTD